MNKIIFFRKKYLVVFLFTIIVSSVHSQQGLFLSHRNGALKIKNTFRADLSGWYQPQEDRNIFGASFTYCPYFSKSQSELRLKAGYLFSNDKLNDAKDITTYLITPNSQGIGVDVGYSKLLSSTDSDSDFEIVFNTDFYYTTRPLSLRQTPYSGDGHYKLRLSSYHLRSGFEIIPIPKLLSFYGNANFLLGVSGKENYQTTSESDLGLLEKAEFIDAGVKVMISVFKYAKIIPDINFIFTEKRIRDRIPGADSVIPTLKVNLTITLP